MKNFVIISGVVVIVLCVLFLTGAIAMEPKQECVKSHQATVHHGAWTQFITTSVKPLIMMPIFHQAYDSTETVCDEYRVVPRGK